jgi:hypothetical protein
MKKISSEQHNDLVSFIVRVTLAEAVCKPSSLGAGAIATTYEYLWLKRSKKSFAKQLVKDCPNLDIFQLTGVIDLAVAMKKSIEYILKGPDLK